MVEANSVHNILEHIFETNAYNKRVRPVIQLPTVTEVNVSLAIIALIEFNEVKESITITGKLTLAWVDEYLRWQPSDYDNVSHIHVLQSDVWKPYIFLENSVSKQKELGTPSLQVRVTYDGKVEWKPVENFHTTCAANVQKFPFDLQKCSMIFEVFGYTSSEITMRSTNDKIEFHEYGGTSGWTIVDTHVEAVDEETVVHVICSLILKRNPTYFVLNIFLPISLLSFLNICVFILPVQSGEKASFVVTVFLSLAVFLTIVSGNLPENSEISMLNIYVFNSTLLSTIIAIVTIIEIRLHNRSSDKQVPRYLTKLATVCSSVRMKSREPVESRDDVTHEYGKTKVKVLNGVSKNDTESLREISDADETRHVNWPAVVKALDNIFFVVFLVVNVVMTITILSLAASPDDIAVEEADEH